MADQFLIVYSTLNVTSTNVYRTLVGMGRELVKYRMYSLKILRVEIFVKWQILLFRR